MVPVCPRSHLEILLLILRQCEILFLWQSEAFSKSKETAVTTRRKNPIHFQQFSHPNDDDNHETEIVTQDNNDNRPECPYGTACYRKNPQHKLEYKHSAPPVPERRTRQKLQKMEKGLWRKMRRMKRRDAA
ncbi:aprataxin and PNK-like factor isoform X4 [Falco rusticolus]|uniref:aprataxin and PNK-like factor isoform X4 n=1 Tax=Falco rusticolus TaxID=120794 RepID=UPI0018868D56|nr:aprataxin and PNK-like factor isoform X4 [Falco rusticolus]